MEKKDTSKKEWVTLSSEMVVDSAYIGLRREICRMPDGRVHSAIYMLDLPDWVQAVALTPEGRVVMVRQYRHGTGEMTVEFPAGCMEKGEAPAESAARELREETGYVSQRPAELLASAHTNPALTGNRIHVCLLSDVTPTGSLEFDDFEDVDMFLADFDEVGGMIDRGEITHIHTRFAYELVKKRLGRQ